MPRRIKIAHRTFALIKPEAVHLCGRIISLIQENDFFISAIRTHRLSEQEAKLFYQQHEDQPWFRELVQYMISGKSLALVLQQSLDTDVVENWRKLMGATDPSKADPSTIRGRFWNGQPLPQNVVHGSDSREAADREIPLFFRGFELPYGF